MTAGAQPAARWGRTLATDLEAHSAKPQQAYDQARKIAIEEEEARADLVHEPPDRPSATESALDAATTEHAQSELERDRQHRVTS